MKLELKELTIDEHFLDKKNIQFTSFKDIVTYLDTSNQCFEKLEKELIVPSSYQTFFIFSFLLVLNFSFSFISLAIKLAIAYFFQQFIYKSKLEFPFSTFIYASCSFMSLKNKINNHKIKTYEQERKNTLEKVLSSSFNKDIIFNYLHQFYKDNQHRLSDNTYKDIDAIKYYLEKENYESAFKQILLFNKQLSYIESFKNEN